MTEAPLSLDGGAVPELRRAVADGTSIRYMVPRAVEEYVRERKLYTLGGA